LSNEVLAQASGVLPVDLESFWGSMGALLLSFVLALPLAWNRERGRRRMGLRTLPLVAVASCSYVLIGLAIAGDTPDAPGRVIAGVVTGIGFIGGGAILKSDEEVRGASTAAAIWATGAVGAAVATGRVELALTIAGLTFLTFLLLTPVREQLMHSGGQESTSEPPLRSEGSKHLRSDQRSRWSRTDHSGHLPDE
jgi:putative Mg2+ transporter-C (MgtC) family protein